MLQDHVNKIEIMRCEVLAWLCYLKAIHGALSWLLNLTKPWYVHLLIKDNQIFFLSPVIMSCLGIIWVMCLYYVTQMSEKWMTPFPVLQGTKMYTFRIFSGNQQSVKLYKTVSNLQRISLPCLWKTGFWLSLKYLFVSWV